MTERSCAAEMNYYMYLHLYTDVSSAFDTSMTYLSGARLSPPEVSTGERTASDTARLTSDQPMKSTPEARANI